MLTILADHNIEGDAEKLWGTLASTGWLNLLPLRLVMFEEVGLPVDTSDREIWRFAQANRMILLTNNRNSKDKDALEQTIREENTSASLPILTIGNPNRFNEKAYRERCADRLVEVVIYLENYLGTGRNFIP